MSMRLTSSSSLISTIIAPDHWQHANNKDINRELIGMITDKDKLEFIPRYNVDYELIWAFDHPDKFFDYFLAYVYSIRSYGYHSPGRPGWCPLSRSKVIRMPGRLISVKWSAIKHYDTPVRHDREYGYRSIHNVSNRWV